ncbi:MAG TPA: S-methyl-5-thioribose-1-phosphate isomerase [Candidatus Polarisedimenticolia bacterium]|nr:S-methyl-5-thioribose-1-phosphate isomerase [Candidatus Polarisedimenticolia bacterium]
MTPETDRRRFFRTFAAQIIDAAATVGRTAGELQRSSQDAARSILEDVEPAAAPTGFRTPFRWGDNDILLVIDQRRLPEALVELPVKSGWDASRVIKQMAVRGAPAIGQVAAIGLALTANLTRKMRPHARQSSILGVADALRRARPTAVNLAWAVDRVFAHYERLGGLEADPDELAGAMRAEADRIVHETTTDHGRMAGFGMAELPDVADRVLNVLTHCNTGPLACGQYGTALGVVQAAHHAGRQINVWVDETRPWLQGSRLTAWELAQAGVSHAVIADGAAGHLMARGEVDAVLVGADRVAANGDTANKIGTYTLAVLAARHRIPFLVVAPLSSVDLLTPDGAAIPIEERPPEEVLSVRDVRIAPPGTAARNPAFDVTPAELITAIVTEEGVLRAPFGPALTAAVDRRTSRWAAEAAASEAAAIGDATAANPKPPVPTAVAG